MYKRTYNKLLLVDSLLNKIEKTLTCILVGSLVLSIFIQIICRYLIKIPTPEMEEIAKYSFIWICYIGGAYALSDDGHVTINIIDSLIEKFVCKKEQLFFVLSKATYFVLFVFLVILSKEFGSYWLHAYKGSQETAAMRIPMYIPYSGVIFGILLMSWHSLVILLKPRIKSDKEDVR